MTAALARLRKRAAELEQKKQFDRALEVYMQILDEGGKDLEDEDVPLFNRVGDMLTRKGRVSDALGYYERAVDVYAERGYLNNAIALCSKILRQSPGRATVYYKLARISARKGFRSDARKNFLEYADRMQKTGQSEEAFRALKEFASLYPDQDDVRLILAELLSKENRKGEALEQLQSLYEKLQSEGRAAEARATVDRMRAIDPEATPTAAPSQPTPAASDLVFLDLTDTEGPRLTPRAETPQPVSARAPGPTPVPALTGLSVTFFPDEEATRVEEPELAPARQESVDVQAGPEAPNEIERVETSDTAETFDVVETFEPIDAIVDTPVEAIETVDPIELATDSPPHIARIEQEIEDLSLAAPAPTSTGTPRSVPALSVYEFADISLDEVPPQPAERKHDLAMPLELTESVDEFESSALELEPVEGVETEVPDDELIEEPVVVSPPALESAAAAEDARAAAEEAADLEADIAAREAVQQPLPATWSTPPQAPAPNEVLERAAGDEELASGEPLNIEGPGGTGEAFPDDFLAQPPSFGAPKAPEEHAFPPLAGLEDGKTPGRAMTPAEPTIPSPTPRDTISIGSPESHLRSRIELDPENWDLHRQLGEALLDTGDRDGGLYELELAMAGFEIAEELDRAQEIVDEILRVTPGSVAHHQKRVEFAVKSRDRSRLAYAYLELADALFRNGAVDKAVAVYGRVLELDSGNERAEFALLTLAPGQLAKLRGAPARNDRWSDEMAAIAKRDAEQPAAIAEPTPVPDDTPGTDARDTAVDDPESAPTPATAHDAGPRARFASIELPVPDWGEGSPVNSPALAAAPETVTEEPEPAPTSNLDQGLENHPAPVAPQDEPPNVAEEVVDRGFARATPPRSPTPWSVPVPDTTSDNGSDSFVDLGEWLRNTEPARSTRMQVEDPRPTGDEQADFEEMLRRFKRGVAENVEAEDYDAHYDLGVAYKEMGLVDEAIAQFQRALKGPTQRVRSYEALGQCFVEKQQYQIAAALLQRATEVPGSDDQQLVGVLYLLGLALEHMGRPQEALPYYLRVFAVDIEFRDIAGRVAALGNGIT